MTDPKLVGSRIDATDYCQMTKKFPHVIIVGAGLAGLAAANTLQEKGFKVEILEARDRIGGRVFTNSSLGFPLDRGAHWIHGLDGNPITELAHRFSANFSLFDSSRFYIFDRSGQRISPESIKGFEADFDQLLARAKKCAHLLPQDQSLADALATVFDPQKKSSLEQDLFKREIAFFENYMGAGYEHLSARNWNQEQNLGGAHAILTSSYLPIIEGLARPCSIRLNTKVIGIYDQANEILVATEHEILRADGVLVTTPLSTLKQKSIHFDPPLPASKQQAIDRLGMGLFNIAALKFKQAFWPKDCQGMFFSQGDNTSIKSFINYQPFCGHPVLLGYSGGALALDIEKQSDPQILSGVMDSLRKQYGPRIPDPLAYFFTRWSQDPYSLGSYSYLPVGASSLDREVLGKPASSRLFFAGEATSKDYPASTHGAYWSGLREAKRIQSFMNCR